MALGENLRLLRKSKGITQKAFAKEFGVSESVISLYESNKRSPSYDLLLQIADFYGVSIDYLLDRSDYVVGPITIGDGKALKEGLSKCQNASDMRRRLAEGVMNQTLLSDGAIRRIWNYVMELE